MLDVLYCLFKQKTAYDMRISDWSSDVCSSDLSRGCTGGWSPVSPVSGGQIFRSVPGFISIHKESAMKIRMLSVALLAGLAFAQAANAQERSEERRVGKECVSTCRSRWSPSH